MEADDDNPAGLPGLPALDSHRSNQPRGSYLMPES